MVTNDKLFGCMIVFCVVVASLALPATAVYYEYFADCVPGEWCP